VPFGYRWPSIQHVRPVAVFGPPRGAARTNRHLSNRLVAISATCDEFQLSAGQKLVLGDAGKHKCFIPDRMWNVALLRGRRCLASFVFLGRNVERRLDNQVFTRTEYIETGGTC
jgi:hypothetical protein